MGVIRRSGIILALIAAALLPILNTSGPAAAVSATYSTQAVPGAGLGGITCPSAGSCVAVGGIFSSPIGAVIDTLGGGTWTPTTLNNQGLTLPFLTGVWCATVSSCIAVGTTQNSPTSAFIETLSSGTWTATTSGLAPTNAVSTALNSIDCLSISSCVATGSWTDSGGTSHALFETLSSGTWTPSTATDPLGSTNLSVNSVRCFSTTSCYAVGYWGPNNSTSNGLLETLSGSTWTASTLQTGVLLRSIWCASSTSCISVGYSGTDATDAGVFESLSGSTWTSGTLPGVGDGGSPNGIVGVSCVGAVTSCVAIGSWRPAPPNSSVPFALIETLANGTWTPLNVGAANGAIFPSGLACPSITSCIGVGSSEALSQTSAILVGSPQVASTPSISNLPPSGSPGGGFTAIVSTNGDGAETVTSNSPAVCTASGLHVTYVGVGTCSLTAHVADGPIYGAADGSPQTFSVSPKHGYWLVGSDGGIFTFGAANFWGSTGNLKLQRPVVGITPTLSKLGYWLVASDGGIFAFGDAPFVGSIPGLGLHPAGSGLPHSLNAPIVAMVPSASGTGYFLVGADGGVFAFNANFSGSCPGIGGCSGTAVGVAPDATGAGYWLVTSNGRVYTFGDAAYLGAPGPQSSSITSIARTPDGKGYWILDANGQVFNYGDAPGLGSLPSGTSGGFNPATTIFSTSDGQGYWVATAVGKVTPFGDAPFDGDMSGTHLNGPIIAATGF